MGGEAQTPACPPRPGSRDTEQLGAVGLGDMCGEGNSTQGWVLSGRHQPHWLLLLSQACPDPHSCPRSFLVPRAIDAILFFQGLTYFLHEAGDKQVSEPDCPGSSPASALTNLRQST